MKISKSNLYLFKRVHIKSLMAKRRQVRDLYPFEIITLSIPVKLIKTIAD